MALISIRNLTVHMGAFVLDRISFDIAAGEYVVINGHTGSGKTTLIESICGLRPIHSGTIHLEGRDVTHLRPAERGVGYVPQDRVLFPSLRVYDHLGFALRIRHVPADETHRRVMDLADLLGLTHLLERRPLGLSGGEAQRVALGRALAMSPAVLLLDEPLTALDPETHDALCDLLQTICRHRGITTLHVTHNIAETHRLADRVLIMKKGRLVEGAGAERSTETREMQA